MSITSPGSINVPIAVGESDSGESGKVMWFNNPEQAKDQLQGGELLEAIELMFSPSPEGGGGASLVGAVVVNETTQATLEAGGFKFLSRRYGKVGNNIQVKIEDGDVTGSKRFVESRWGTDFVSIYDNVGAVLRLEYTGEESYAGVSVTKTDGVATKIETKIGADESSAQVDVSIELDSSRFHNIEQILRHFNSVSDYTATYVDSASSGMSSKELDEITDVEITSGGYLLSEKGDLIHRLESSDLVRAEELSGSVENFSSSYLSGGDGGLVPQSWSSHFDAIKREFSDMLVVLSKEKTIQAEALNHIQQMKRRHQRQIMFTGGGIDESTDEIIERASNLNSSDAVIAYPGIRSNIIDNSNKVLPSYMTGALLAGRVAGVDPTEPITFDQFNVITLERDLVAGDPDIDRLITSGVATLEKIQNGGIRLVQGITTYLGSNNSLFREISVKRGADYLSGNVRKGLEDTFVGRRGLPATTSAVMSKTIDILEESLRNEEITAYRNIVVRFEGTAIWVNYEVAPIEPINFVLVTSHFVPDSNISTSEV